MLRQLHTLLPKIPLLLQETTRWKGLHIDYHAPIVDRVWTEVGENRLSLHRIQPCGPGEALWHPHPWPSAVILLCGSYETGISANGGASVLSTCILCEGSSYEMTDPSAWHYVRPLMLPSYSIMLSGPPWKQRSPEEEKKDLSPLGTEEVNKMLATFRELIQEVL